MSARVVRDSMPNGDRATMHIENGVTQENTLNGCLEMRDTYWWTAGLRRQNLLFGS
jgi:hypothetical protein